MVQEIYSQQHQYFGYNIFLRRGTVSFKRLREWTKLSLLVNDQSSFSNAKTFLHSQKIGVWCAASRKRIVGLLFFESAVDGSVYRELIQQFVALLEVNERYSWFQ